MRSRLAPSRVPLNVSACSFRALNEATTPAMPTPANAAENPLTLDSSWPKDLTPSLPDFCIFSPKPLIAFAIFSTCPVLTPRAEENESKASPLTFSKSLTAAFESFILRERSPLSAVTLTFMLGCFPFAIVIS